MSTKPGDYECKPCDHGHKVSDHGHKASDHGHKLSDYDHKLSEYAHIGAPIGTCYVIMLTTRSSSVHQADGHQG